MELTYKCLPVLGRSKVLVPGLIVSVQLQVERYWDIPSLKHVRSSWQCLASVRLLRHSLLEISPLILIIGLSVFFRWVRDIFDL